MTTSDEVLRRLIAQVGSGVDVVIDADPAGAQRLVSRACNALAGGAGVTMAASPVGELSLSSLIAQISGRPDFDGQDDSVLELGFKRLHEAGRRTVLVLQAPHGMSRSALRYVQHVSRHASGLVLVVLASPALDKLLEEPVFAALRTRLRAAPPLGAGMALPTPVSTVPPRRRRLFWTVSALGIAAMTAAVAWVGYGPSFGSPRVQMSMPLVPAVTPPPPLAAVAIPQAAVLPPSPPRATLDRATVARRVVPPPRDTARYGRARRSWPAWPREEQDSGRYAWDQSYPEPPPWVARREPRYFRPYADDRFGAPVFPYEN